MKISLWLFVFLFISTAIEAQYVYTGFPSAEEATAYRYQPSEHLRIPKLYQRNFGAILGLQRGAFTSFELGAEGHWRKISLRKPRIIGATANMEYNFSDHVMGYKAGMWVKRGRVNLTYGANLVYFTDFKNQSRYGIGPSVGFRLLGFHLINGYNFLAGGEKEEGKEEPFRVNTLYLTLRYYFPVENKFTWDKSKKAKEREKAREKRKKQKAKEKKKKEKEKEKGGGFRLFGL